VTKKFINEIKLGQVFQEKKKKETAKNLGKER